MKKSEALNILGLSEGATADEIKKAHRKKAMANHPDNFANDPAKRAKAEEDMKLINEARDVLESGKFDPEYGSPFGGGRRGGSPFGGTTYTYTYTYDADNPNVWPFGANPDQAWRRWQSANPGSQGTPYDPFNPFASQVNPTETAKRQADRARSSWIASLITLVLMIGLAAMYCVGGNFVAGGLVFCVLVLLGSIISRYGGCAWIFILFFLPILGQVGRIGYLYSTSLSSLIVVGLLTAGALVMEIRELMQLYRRYKAAKEVYEKAMGGE